MLGLFAVGDTNGEGEGEKELTGNARILKKRCSIVKNKIHTSQLLQCLQSTSCSKTFA